MHRFALVLLTACGSVQTSAPDAGSTADAPAAGPVAVDSISPADGATKVGVLAPITIHLTGAADPASVTPASVKLATVDVGQQYGATLIAYDVSYDDATHTITVAPRGPLARATAYQVDVGGVTAAGAPIAAAKARFATVVNPITSWQSSSETGTYEHDAAGLITVRVDSSLADHSIEDWSQTTRGPGVVDIIVYGGAGTDGTWRTADDTVTTHLHYDVEPAGIDQSISYPGGGAKAGSYTTVARDAQGRRTIARYRSAGTDGVVGNADDTTSSHGDFTYSGDWDALYVSYDGAGSDHANNYSDFDYDDRGVLLSIDAYGAGADGLPHTADDVHYAHEAYEHDARGLSTRDVVHTFPGDATPSYTSWHYDAGGNLTEVQQATTGSDGIVGTADDVITYVERHDPTL